TNFRIKGTRATQDKLCAIGSRVPRSSRHRGGCYLLRPLSNDREQPGPAHRPWPAPELPGLLTLGDREEDDLGAADQVLERHEANRRFHAAVGGVVAVVAHH